VQTIVFGSLFQVAGYCIQTAAPPFPAFILAYFLNGFGLALQDSQANGFVATLSRNAEVKMGVLHASYGLGAFASPLAATHFAQQKRWSFHFLLSLSRAVINTIALISVFRLKSQDGTQASLGSWVDANTSAQHVCMMPAKSSQRRVQKMKRASSERS
jgi:fucose permease